jgi:hypothetical protein
VFENDDVRVMDVQVASGAKTLYHIHSVASVIVELSDVTIVSQEMGKPAAAARKVAPGDTRYAAYDEIPVTHQVANQGPGRFHVLDIELVRSNAAGELGQVAPSPGVKVAWEKKLVRLYQIHLAGQKPCEFQPSNCAHLLVGITGGANTVTRSGGKDSTRKLAAGEFLFFPAHAGFRIHPLTKADSDYILLELR